MASKIATPFLKGGKPVTVSASERRDLERMGVKFPKADKGADENTHEDGPDKAEEATK